MKYHQWMVSHRLVPGESHTNGFLHHIAEQCVMHVQEDPILREATASERLTLEVRSAMLQDDSSKPRACIL